MGMRTAVSELFDSSGRLFLLAAPRGILLDPGREDWYNYNIV